EEGEVLFVAGTAINQGKFHVQFDYIILLSAPAEVIVERLVQRRNNPYGSTPRTLARVLEHLETVEPLLRRAAGHEIDASAPVEEVVAAVLRIVQVEDN
ncbi:MAG: hypothetical protein RRC07_17335, partial [Anaerolineae bacterium]|nr:hypothetical protein [Anaerolineae bacterium]